MKMTSLATLTGKPNLLGPIQVHFGNHSADEKAIRTYLKHFFETPNLKIPSESHGKRSIALTPWTQLPCLVIHANGSVFYQAESGREQPLLPEGSVRYDGAKFSCNDPEAKTSAFPVPPLTSPSQPASSRRLVAKDFHLIPGFHEFGKRFSHCDYDWLSGNARGIENRLGDLGGPMENDRKPGMVIFKDGDGRLCLFATGAASMGMDSAYRPVTGSFLMVGQPDGKMTPQQKIAFLSYYQAIDKSIPLNVPSNKVFQALLDRDFRNELVKQFGEDGNQLIAEPFLTLQQEIRNTLDYKTLLSRPGSVMVNRTPDNVVALYTLLTSDAMKDIQKGEVVAAITRESLDYIKQHSQVSKDNSKEAIYPDVRWILAGAAPENSLV